MHSGHLIALAVIRDLRENSLVLRANERPEPSALFAQKADALSPTEPSAHRLRLHAMLFGRMRAEVGGATRYEAP
jgi:hypothetical protein